MEKSDTISWVEARDLGQDDLISHAYLRFLGRLPEEGVLGSIKSRILAGEELSNIVLEIVFSEEAARKFRRDLDSQSDETRSLPFFFLALRRDWVNYFSLPIDEFIESCYLLLLQRTPDLGGLVFYRDTVFPSEGKLGIFSRIYCSRERRSNLSRAQRSKKLIRINQFGRTPVFGFLLRKYAREYKYFRSLDGVAVTPHLPAISAPVRSQSVATDLLAKQQITGSELAVIASDLNLYTSINRLHGELQLQRPSRLIAVVTVNPSDKTGIASFNEDVFYSDTSASFHLFVPFRGEPVVATMSRRGNQLKYFDIKSLWSAVQIFDYDAIIVVTGNSNHNIEAFSILSKLPLELRRRTIIEIHDPFLFNVTIKASQTSASEYLSMLAPEVANDSVILGRVSSGDYSDLISRGITGLAALQLAPKEFRGFIFHSHAACRIFSRDFSLGQIPHSITLFHPVFDEFSSKVGKNRSEIQYIGSFGVPGDDKLSSLVLRAFKIVAIRRPWVRLLFVGYGADRWVGENVESYYLDVVKGIEAADEAEFLSFIKKIAVAVQLRGRNLGESSGVIPRMLSADTPTICSRVGAHAEHDDAVFYAECTANADDIASLIEAALDRGLETSSVRRAYCEAHTVARFRNDLFGFLSSSQ